MMVDAYRSRIGIFIQVKSVNIETALVQIAEVIGYLMHSVYLSKGLFWSIE